MRGSKFTRRRTRGLSAVVAAVLLSATATAAVSSTPASATGGVDINGGQSWNGWISRGVSNQLGVWSAGSTTAPRYEIYTTTFTFDRATNVITGSPIQDGRGLNRTYTPTSYNSGSATANNPTNRPVTSGGAFDDGNQIFGIGLRILDNAAFEARSTNSNLGSRLNGRWGGWQFITFGRNEGSNTSFTPASSVGAGDGRFGYQYTHAGDFGAEFAPSAMFGAQEISIAAADGSFWGGPTPNHVNFPGGSTGYEYAFRAFAQDDDASDVHAYQMFFDLTAMAKLYGPDVVSEDSILDNYGYGDTLGIGQVDLSKLNLMIYSVDQGIAFGAFPSANGAPVATAASATTPEDIPVVISPVVTDPNSDPTTVSVVTGPANGSAVVSGSGSFTYTPGANFTGVDSFTYKANDGSADSNIATITVTVTPVTAKWPDLRIATAQPPRITNPGVQGSGQPLTVVRTYTISRTGTVDALNRISRVQWQTNPAAKNPATPCASVPATNTGTPACNFVGVAPTTVTFQPGETSKTITVTVVGVPSAQIPIPGLNYRVELFNAYKANIKKGVHTMRISRN